MIGLGEVESPSGGGEKGDRIMILPKIIKLKQTDHKQVMVHAKEFNHQNGRARTWQGAL